MNIVNLHLYKINRRYNSQENDQYTVLNSRETEFTCKLGINSSTEDYEIVKKNTPINSNIQLLNFVHVNIYFILLCRYSM